MHKSFINFLVIIFVLSASTQADVIGFNDLAGTDIPGNNSLSPYGSTSFDGINIAEIDGFYIGSQNIDAVIGTILFPNDNGAYAYNGTDYFVTESPDTASLVIERVDGRLFNFHSIDFCQFGSWVDTVIVITGYDASNNVIKTETVTLDGTLNSSDQDGNDFERFTFTDYQAISKLEFSTTTHIDYLAIDNFVHEIYEVCPNPPLSDLNGDCIVNLADLAIMASEWFDCNLFSQEGCP